MSIARAPFDVTPDGRQIDAFSLTNAHGLSLTIVTLGAIVQSVRAPDRNGRLANIVLSFETLAPYLDNRDYVGCVIGRFANRIARGRFRLDGRDHQLSRNEGENTLHGGAEGFDKAVWSAEIDGERLLLSHRSPDGDQGFPGELTVTIAYALSDANEFSIAYEARTSAPTVLSLTNHIYWRLSGYKDGDILDHTLEIAADRFTPVDAEMIPLGTFAGVEGTPLDLRQPRPLRDVLQAVDPRIADAGGLDHNFVLHKSQSSAARLFHPSSGRQLEVFTTEPALQVYSGNHLRAHGLSKWSGIALETQRFPDAPNQPAFPSAVLRPGGIFRSSTTFRIT